MNFIETPFVAPSLDARGFDDGKFAYDDHNDVLRDVRNYTSNHSADSLSPTRAVGDAAGDLSVSFPNKFVAQPTLILNLHLLDLLLPTMRLGRLVVRLTKIGLPRRGKSVPRCRSTMRLLLDRHQVRRRRLVHRPLVLLRLILRRRLVLCVDVVHLVVDEVPRRRLQPPICFELPTAKTISKLRRLPYALTARGEFPDVAHMDGTFGFRNTRTLWEQCNRVFHGQSRKRLPRPKPPSRTQQQNARSRVLKIIKFTSLFRALPFPLDGSESI